MDGWNWLHLFVNETANASAAGLSVASRSDPWMEWGTMVTQKGHGGKENMAWLPRQCTIIEWLPLSMVPFPSSVWDAQTGGKQASQFTSLGKKCLKKKKHLQMLLNYYSSHGECTYHYLEISFCISDRNSTECTFRKQSIYINSKGKKEISTKKLYILWQERYSDNIKYSLYHNLSPPRQNKDAERFVRLDLQLQEAHPRATSHYIRHKKHHIRIFPLLRRAFFFELKNINFSQCDFQNCDNSYRKFHVCQSNNWPRN